MATKIELDSNKRNAKNANDGDYVFVVEAVDAKGATIKNVDNDTVAIQGNAADYIVKATGAGVIVTKNLDGLTGAELKAAKQFKLTITLQKENAKKGVDAGVVKLAFADGSVDLTRDGKNIVTNGGDIISKKAKDAAALEIVNADETFDNQVPADDNGGQPGQSFTLTTDADDILVGNSSNNTFEGTNLTYNTGDLLLDQNANDNDVLNLTTTQNIVATPTVNGIETINVAVEKVGLFTFDALNISGAKTVTVNRGDLLDGSIDGTGAVQIDNARAATFNAGTKVSDITVNFSATGNSTAAAVVNAGTGAVTVTEVGQGGVTVNGAAGKAVSVAETTVKTGSKATINSSGDVNVTNAVDELTLQGAGAAAVYTVNAIGDKLTLAGASDLTVKIAGDALTTEEVLKTATGSTTIEVTAASTADLDLSDVAAVSSIVLGADFNGETITVNSNQLITTKTNQGGTVTIDNAGTTGSGVARFAVLSNAADAAVTVGTLDFGASTAFETVYIDATADKFTATTGVTLNDADLVLTGSQDVDLGAVTDAGSITSASTGKVSLVSTGNTANEQVIALGAGADTVTVNSGTDLFVVNLGNGDNTLTITNAKAESQFVTGSGADKVTLTDAQGIVSIVTGAGDDVITLGAAGNVTWNGTTINGGEGSDTLKATVTDDISGATLTSIEKVDVANAATLTIDADQFNALASFQLQGAGTLEVDASAETDAVTLDASKVGIAFGTTATLKLIGGAGDDVITSSIAADVMTGNAGKDTFVFAQNSGNTSSIINEITDFLTGTDKLKLGVAGSATNFAALDGSDNNGTATTYANALTAAQTALDGTVQFALVSDGATAAESWLFVDFDKDGNADLAITLTGLASTDVVATDIIA